jgi:hypothetical protein
MATSGGRAFFSSYSFGLVVPAAEEARVPGRLPADRVAGHLFAAR